MSPIILTYNDTDVSMLIPSSSGLKRARLSMPAGVIKNGQVHNNDAFAKLLQPLLNSYAPLGARNHSYPVVIGLPEEHAFVKLVAVPSTIKRRELDSALSFQWQNIMPIGKEQVYYDSLLLPNHSKDKANRYYLIIAYSKAVVDSIVGALESLNLKSQQLVPLSFGYANLFSQPHGASMVIVTEDGLNLQVTIIESGTTRFSTLIHAEVGSPAVIKQLQNSQKFYEQSVDGTANKITQIVIVQSRFSQLLAKQVAELGVPVEVSHMEQILRTRGQHIPLHDSAAATPPITITRSAQGVKVSGGAASVYELDHYTPLFGLFHLNTHLSILPPKLEAEHTAYQQIRIVLVHLFVVALAVFVGSYLMFDIHQKLQSQARTVATPSADLAQLNKEEEVIAQEIARSNKLVEAIKSATSKRSNVTPLVLAVYKSASTTEGISISSVRYAAESRQLTLSGTRANREALTRFVEALKTNTSITAVNPSLASWQAEGSSTFDITITEAKS